MIQRKGIEKKKVYKKENFFTQPYPVLGRMLSAVCVEVKSMLFCLHKVSIFNK